jgi:hypothetical protein
MKSDIESHIFSDIMGVSFENNYFIGSLDPFFTTSDVCNRLKQPAEPGAER